MNYDALTQVDVESRIEALCAELERQVTAYAHVAEQRAAAESDFKFLYSRALVEQTTKVPVATKEAVAHLKASNSFREWKLFEAREKATQQALTSIRAQLDSLRTISANVRAAGG